MFVQSTEMRTHANMLAALVVLLPLICAQDKPRLCGTMNTFFSTDGRIVGGDPAPAYAWPWQVYISFRGQFICGGTLIDPQYVVSAAHCVVGQSFNPSDYLIRVGAHNMAQQGFYSGTVYRVVSLRVHEQYVNAESGYDVSIMRLSTAVAVSDTVNVICLPSSANLDLPTYQPVVISGFGVTSEGGRVSSTLQQAVIQFLPTCGNVYDSFDSNSQLCAGLRRGGRDSCQGDSGGPLVYQPRRSSQWVLIGITSYGNGCARINYPGVYTKVSAYLSWILRIIGQK